MAIVIGHLTVDCADPAPLAQWWSEVLDWPVESGDDPDEIWIGPEGGTLPGILFLRAPDAKIVKNRLHLDLRPADGSDQATELGRLLDHGAVPIDIGQGDVPWHVLADPAGNEFCLLRGTPSELARTPTEGTGC
jgi:hypothetical protein